MKPGLSFAQRPDWLDALIAFVTGRPPRPAPVLVPIAIKRTTPVRIPVRRPSSI